MGEFKEHETWFLPTYWGSYLINGDASGYDYSEINQIEKFLDSAGRPNIVSMDDDEHFTWRNDAFTMGCNVSTFHSI